MKNIIFILAVFLIAIPLFSVIEETASLSGFIYGEAAECEYDNWLSHIVEGIADPGYNLYAPWDVQTTGFGNFVEPDDDDLVIWENITIQFLAGNLDTAQEMLSDNGYPYQVVIFNDTDTGRTFHIMRENLNLEYYDNNNTDHPDDDEIGSFDYGWGLFIYAPDSSSPHITTVTHPADDYIAAPIAHKVFIEQDSKSLLLAGCGREVLWQTNNPPYTNGNSLCDPSRVDELPYNIFYKKVCDKIREDFDQREFSIQIHSCDWGTRHWGSPDLQISGGYSVSSPDLPIRDHSSHKKDIVNVSEHLIFPANSIGMNAPVYLNDYYGFHSELYDFTFSNQDTTYSINRNIDLWGYSANKQMQYTHQSLVHYDNFEPFFHIELDELPNVYPQTTSNYHWFHGWDPVQQKWNYTQRFSYVLQYYSYWVEALAEVLPDMYEMNDNSTPAPPSNLEIISENGDNIIIQWQPGDAYDIYSYEILYANEPILNNTYTIVDRANRQNLACLAQNTYTLYDIPAGEEFYFAVRLKDKNGNTSALSNEVMTITAPVVTYNFNAYGYDSVSRLSWLASSEAEYDGYNVYRKIDFGEYELLASWQTEPELCGVIGTNENFSYSDHNVENGVSYTYKLTAEDNGVEYIYNEERTAIPQKIFNLVAMQTAGTFGDSIYFGYNHSASDGYENSYDVISDDSFSGYYFATQFYESNWSASVQQLDRHIKGYYDTQTNLRSWVYRLKTNQLNQEVEISISNLDRNAERIYLLRDGQFINLAEESFFFTPTNENFQTFYLYLGNLTPSVVFGEFNNQLLYPNETIDFIWSVDYQITIDHLNLYAENDDITIPLATEMDPSVNQASWIVPQLLFENLSLRLDVVMEQGDTLHYYSHFKFGIISPQNIVQTDQGWNLITKNFDTDQYTNQQIFGNDVDFYELINDDFQMVQYPSFLQPYWLYAEENNLFTLNSCDLQRAAYITELEAGWNLLPNPHRAHYDLHQLQFSLNNNSYDYYEAVQNELIEPAVFSYEDDLFPVYELDAARSYYIFCYQEGISVNFVPYYESEFIPEFDLSWLVDITAEQNNLQSSVIIGTSPAADSLYDFSYDLLKPLAVPFEQNITFSIPLQIDGEEQQLHQSVITAQNAAADFSYIWNAQLQLADTQTITLAADNSQLPANHYLYLQIDEEILDLGNNDFVEYDPVDTTIDFTILITDEELVDVENALIAAPLSAMNYPNPFNPQTTIKFNLPETGKVDLTIYNIKGQKVKQLIADNMPAGRHSIIWNGVDSNNKNVASGVYFYKLQAGSSKPIVNKMMLLK